MVVLLLCGFLIAQEIVLSLEADQIARGQTTVLFIDFINIEDARAPIFPKGDGVSVELQNKRPDRSFVYENGIARRTLRYRYTILGIAEGEWKLGPVSLAYKGRSRVSNQVSVKVTLPFDDAQNTPSTVEGHLPKETLYAGEVVSYQVRYQLRETGVFHELIPAEYTGLSPLMGISAQEKRSRIWEGTELVEVTDVWFPMRVENTNRYEITAPKVRLEYIAPADESTPTMFFQKQYKEKFFIGNECLGVIKALPRSPQNFSGLIGEFFFRSYPKKRVVDVGEPVEIVMEIWGNGVLQGFRFPPHQEKDFEIFDERPTVDASFVEGKYQSKWTMIRTLLPSSGGKYILSPFSLIVFDPVQEKYTTLQSDPIILQIQGGKVVDKTENEPSTSVVVPAWVDSLPESKAMPLPPWWSSWILGVFPLLWIGKNRQSREKVPVLPSMLPEDSEERLALLESSLEDFLKHVQQNKCSFSEEKIAIAKQALYLARYGGETVDDVESKVRQAMVIL